MSLTARIGIFSSPPPREGLVVSRSPPRLAVSFRRFLCCRPRDRLRNDAARPGYGNDLAEFKLGFQKPSYYPVSPKGSRFPRWVRRAPIGCFFRQVVPTWQVVPTPTRLVTS